MSALGKGWAEKVAVIHGDTEQEDRMRERGSRPFRVCADDVAAKGRRGGLRGIRSRVAARKLDEVLGPVEDDE